MLTKEMLRELRKSKGYTGQQVADELGISYKVYQTYESGARNAGLPVVEKLADFYGVSTDYLLGREPKEQGTIDKLAGEFNMNALEKKILEGYLDLPKTDRSDFMDFLHRAVLEVKEESAPDYGPMNHSAVTGDIIASAAEAEKDA